MGPHARRDQPAGDGDATHLRSSDKNKKEVFPIAIQTIQTVEDG
jgi:hypothetical protein